MVRRRSVDNRLHLFLLGRFELERDFSGRGPAGAKRVEHTQRVLLPARKSQLLLAYLALYPRPHPREELAGLLWGDVPDAQARGSLRRALALVRKPLGGALLLADRESVQLNPAFPLWVDASEFARRADVQSRRADFASEAAIRDLQSALALYRGDLLAGSYEDWILRERERYRGLYLDALLHLAHWMRTHAGYEQAIAFAQHILASDAAHEPAHQVLMQCYLTLGQRAAALKQYETCRRSLRQELGVEPSPDTLALYRQIQQAAVGRPSPAVAPGNLPVPPTSFIGRERELAELKRLLAITRLLTLTGAGGCGKTRLANRLATDVVREYPDGVWWVELGALMDSSLVPQTVAKVLGVSETPEQPIAETLADYVRPKQMLLVLDNCEHLVEACAPLAERLLQRCPHLRILATSRQALNLPAESAWIVPSLAVPALSQVPGPMSHVDVDTGHWTEDLGQSEAVQLLVERARAVKPDFALTAANALAVAHICRRLDGIPLALELAAARLRLLSAAQVVERLHDAFALLTTSQRTDLPRHKTLRATIEWSYALLSEPEQILFRRLSAFAGDFSLEAVESICAGDGLEKRAILDLLSDLVDKSLVLCVEKSNQMRYRLLETIREYARERLDEAGERETVCRRHLDFYLAFTEEAKAGLASPQEAASWELMETEYANVLAALDWSYSGDSHLDACVTLFGILADFWERRGRPSEGNKWLAGVLARSEKSSASGRAEALYGAGILTSNDDPAEAERLLKESLAIRRDLGETRTMPATLVWLGDLARMRGDDVAAWTYYEELLTICQAMGNRKGVAGAMANLGNEALSSGDYEKARYYLEESLRLRRELNYSIGIAWSANSLGEWARCLGDYARAAPLYDEALRLFRETGVKKGVGWALQNLGHVAQHERDYARAETLFRESLLDFHEYPLGIASSLAGLAGVAGAVGQPLRAGCLFGAMEAILERIESRLDRADLLAYERNLAETRAQADPPAFAAAWAEGRALSLEQAVAFALAT